MSGVISRERSGGVAVVRLEHGKANALDTELLTAIADECESLKASGARAVVLTGRGEIFCAGVDLFRALDEGPEYMDTFGPALIRAFRALFMLPMPVVAAANGHAIAGGCIIVCACDYRILEQGRIGVPELPVGVAFPTTALEIMRYATPAHHRERVILGGETFEPEQALELGLIDEIGGFERTMEVARRYAEFSPEAYSLTKQRLRAPALARMTAEDPDAYAIWRSEETRTRIRAYLDRVIGK